MNIVYIVSAYKYPEQLIRLIARLNTSNAFFFIHVDKKTDDTIYSKMMKDASHLSNVFFLKRHPCYWGDFGHVLATIKGLKEALHRNIDFDYIFVLTGQDYPIKPNDYIDQFLQKNNGKEFIDYFPIPLDGWGDRGGLDRIDTWQHFKFYNKYLRGSKIESLIRNTLMHLFPERKLPNMMKPFGGSAYWSITKGCAEYINQFIGENKWFIRYFKNVRIPDEIFFQTIILNSPFKENVINDDLRCIDWSRGDGYGPRVWCKEDMDILSQSNALIARKFDATVDSEVMNLIDSKLLSK